MDINLLKLINVNRDAIASNRGFYYQFLNVALTWITRFANGENIDVYTEVDDDIKEVGNEIVFTQLKCYSNKLSFKSKEVQKAILNFFVLYHEHKERGVNLRFCFTTNTSLNGKEKFLSKWVDEHPNISEELFRLCESTVRNTLTEQVNLIKRNRLNAIKKPNNEKKNQIEGEFLGILEIIKKSDLGHFIQAISWKFDEEDPANAITQLTEKILQQLGNPIFGKRSVKLLLNAILSDIYRCSQLPDKNDRALTRDRLQLIIDSTDEEIASTVNVKLINFLNVRLELLEDKVQLLDERQTVTTKTIEQQKQILENLVNDKKTEKKTIPKEITKIPFIETRTLFDIEKNISEVHSIFSNEDHLAITGARGIGKSTLLKCYAKSYYEEYEHLIWINAESGISNSLVINSEVIKSLGLKFSDEDNYSDRFDMIKQALNDLKGKNLLLIDGYDKKDESLKELQGLRTWKILISSRLPMMDWIRLKVDKLDFNNAKNLFFSSDQQEIPSEHLLRTFFEYIDYNTLVIYLVSKSLSLSFGLKLDDIISRLEDQNLDDEHINIELYDVENNIPNLFTVLKTTFNLGELDNHDQYFIEFFAIISLENTHFDDLVEMYGPIMKKQNRIELTKIINRLHQKGFIDRSGQYISMHKMIRESAIYHFRENLNPFAGQAFHYAYICERMKEGVQRDLNMALRYLKYAESILTNIKELYRIRIQQPMIALENEVLNLHGWINPKDDLLSKWGNLFDRATQFLKPEDSLRGVISNNLGLALAYSGDFNGAKEKFDLAIKILKDQGEKSTTPILLSLTNIGHLYLANRDFKNYKKCMDTILSYLGKRNSSDGYIDPIITQLVGTSYFMVEDYQKAIEYHNLAINLHLRLPETKRNDIYLINFIDKLTACYLLNGDIEKADKTVSYALRLYGKLNMRNLLIYKTLLLHTLTISRERKDTKLESEITEILDKLPE